MGQNSADSLRPAPAPGAGAGCGNGGRCGSGSLLLAADSHAGLYRGGGVGAEEKL